MRLVRIALLTILLAGCAPTLHGGGNVEQWRTDLRACNLETLGYGFIPDFGVTKDFHLRKCMKDRFWVKTVDLTGWAWIGPGATLELYRYPNGDQQMVLVCPNGKTCETVRFVSDPTDGIAWGYQAWPEETSRRLAVFIVGDQATCETVRQRDESKGIVVSPICEGPRYFERITTQATKK